MSDKIFAIVVAYNGMKWYPECLNSLKQSSVRLEIIVVDNGSDDGTSKFIGTNYPEIKLIRSNENLGFGRANNLGMKFALEQQADYTFLLNQDARVESNTIEKLIKVHQQYSIFGILSPMHLNGDGSQLDGGFENYAGPEYTDNLLSDLFLHKKEQVYETRFVNAAAWLISRKCVEKVGGFDPIFFHYGEDLNYCQRVQYHGLKVGIVPDARIFHHRVYQKESYGKSQILRHYLLTMTDIRNDLYKKAGRRLRQQDYARIISGLMHGNIKKVMQNWENISEKRKYRQKINISREQNQKGGLLYL